MTTTANDGAGLEPVLDEATLDELMSRVDEEGLELLGPDGVLTEITSKIMNRALEAEMADHLGYERGDPAGEGSGNNRNGHYDKMVLTDAGGIPIRVPRDRNGEFDPQLVPKHQRRLSGFNDLICGLMSRGMTTRDICDQLAETYDVSISPELVSKITDAIMPEVRAWLTRPLDAVYPIVYMDAIVVKVRTDGRVINRPCYIALGVDLAGYKHVLGLWLGHGGEGAKYWLSVCTEIRNRGVNDVMIVCVDGLTGFGEAIEAVWPQATVQTSLVILGVARDGLGCHPHRRERTSAARPLRSRRRPVPSVGDGPRTAIRSSASSAETSAGGGLSWRMI